MTLLLNIGTAFSVFLLSVFILSSNYNTIWSAPNFVTHSATFDFVFQDIASNSFSNQIDIEYAYKSNAIPTLSSNLHNINSSILEKQSNLHHLQHIPPWALVPDRISSTSGSVTDLFKIFDSLSSKQEQTLSVLSDIIEIIPTESSMKSHMEHLSASQKYWIKNMSMELFNASQTILSYQLMDYAEEIQVWIQNSPHSNDYLRLLFERIRGWPLLYNPSIKHSKSTDLSSKYQSLCQQIIAAMDHEDDSNDDGILSLAQCEIFCDSVIPWLPDKSPTLTTMWPNYYNVEVDELRRIEGIGDPYTLVIRQQRKPSGEVLHYVSPKGDERIQVEWFDEEHHLRATNLAFVRRIRVQIKRIAKILKNSVTLSVELDPEDELEALWASLDEEEDDGPKPSDRHIEQLPDVFKEYIKNYATELEKGQFDNILNMDLAQNDHSENQDIFIHGLPSIAVFNDGGIKRAWNFILGVIDHELVPKLLSKNGISKGFIASMNIKSFQSAHHRESHGLELEILGVWPYAVAGYLRAITPELATYSYPPYADAKKVYGKQRCVLLLDVLDKVYTNNMRQIGIQRLIDNDDAKLITLASTIKYLSSLLMIEHVHFHNHDEFELFHTLKQGLFMRLSALIECVGNDNNSYGCVLSGVMYNIIEGFSKDNPFSLVFVAFLQKEGLIKWDKKSNGKDVINVMHGGKDLTLLQDQKLWKTWNKKYFEDVQDAVIEQLKNELVGDKDMMKIYKRIIRHVAKYSVVRRPGEDTFVLP